MTVSHGSLSPHEILMLACSIPFCDGNTRQAISVAASAQGLDWPVAARMGMRHGIAHAMAAHVSDAEVTPLMSPDVRRCFERIYRANGLRNQVMFREAARFQRALAAASVECLILKGVALALTVYPEAAWRNFADIDLLVHPRDYNAVCELAEACGFHCSFPEKDPFCSHQPYALSCPEDILTETLPLEFDHSIPTTVVADNCHRVLIEIHRCLFHDVNGIARESASELVWHGVRRGRFPDGTPFDYPSTEVMLFHVASHAADHGFGRLMFFMDLAAVVQQGGDTLDWDRVVRLSVENDVRAHVYRSLEFAHRVLGATVPPAILRALTARPGYRTTKLSLNLQEVLSAPLENERSRFIKRLRFSQNRYYLCMSVLTTVAPPPLVMRRIYGVRHPLIIALLYVIRPFVLTWRLLSHLLGRLCHLAGMRRMDR